ncbi:MAG TPA: sodium-dependent transporter [Longimicrobiales bacterium]
MAEPTNTQHSGLFTSRWGMMLAMLGMAVGTGNIWRFPRVVANNGGGSFLIAWACFLLLWSVPLIMIEFTMGKHARQGTIGAFMKVAGKKFAWMGAWVAWTSTAIMFYYAVVMAWTLRYAFAALVGEIPTAQPGGLWESFSYSWQVLPVHAISMALGIWVVARGVRGIETASRWLMPTLIIMVMVLAIRAVTLPGAVDGLNFMFWPDWEQLAYYRTWLEALTQNAWDTGAGWGLIVAYAIYMRKGEDTALNAFMLGFGNNSVSLMAGIMVLCTVFAIMPDAAAQITGAGNEGLTFIWVPQLFALMPLGRLFMFLFFLALLFAAWTSLVSMIELAVRVLADLGVSRKKAIALVGSVGFLLGVPSALSADVFANQDWVWGVGLMVSGLFYAIAVLRFGVRRFREQLINTPDADIRIGAWWDWAVRFVVVQAVVLVAWWLYTEGGVRQMMAGEFAAAFSPYGLLNTLIQWGAAIAFFVIANGWMVRRTERFGGDHPELPQPPASIP